MKPLRNHLRETASYKQGGCWMQDFEPQIIEAVEKWLEQERDAYAEDITNPLGQRVLIGTFVSGLIKKAGLKFIVKEGSEGKA